MKQGKQVLSPLLFRWYAYHVIAVVEGDKDSVSLDILGYTRPSSFRLDTVLNFCASW